ncbi:MAG: pyroglutamyl-peptidase I [Comamonadaceae bacterium]|nr:pyroglutamyl-peptidase I [Burkholderiales bacterium]MEB2349001.1 pyroglutamyl-peptidase I [Comamonadaceae bacterium]
MVTSAATSPIPAKPGPHAVVLVTGFDAFGGAASNPSTLVAQALHRRQIAGCRVVGAQLPTVFGAALTCLDALLERHQPSLVICLGLAAERATLQLERVAINREDARIADNRGAQPVDRPVIAGAPAAYLSTLPIEAMVRAMTAAGVPTDTSQSAGTFVCNHVFFGLMHRLATVPALQTARGGFIHLPQLSAPGRAGMPLAQMVHGVRTGIRTAIVASATPQRSRHASRS